MNILKKREQIVNYVFLAGLFVMLMLNLNEYEWYHKVANYNGVLTAILLTVILLCTADIKTALTDKKLLLIILINAIALANIIISGTGVLSLFTVYDVTLALYLADKVVLSKRQTVITIAFLASFFFYWKYDVKGYFKGYSINFGGLVLIFGFVFLIILMEYLKYRILNSHKDNRLIGIVKKYPFYITFLEAVLFVQAYNIIAWYRSRTAFFALLFFLVLLLIPKKVLLNRIIYVLTILATIVGLVEFPSLYVMLGNLGVLSGKDIFYKSLVDLRMQIYPHLSNMIKLHPFVGNGTIVVEDLEPFREGLLDTCNGFMQIAESHGLVVAVLVLGLLFFVLLGLASKMKNNMLSTTVFCGLCTLLVASYSESFLFSNTFVIILSAILIVFNSVINIEPEEIVDTASVYKQMFSGEYKVRFIPVLSVTVMILFMYLILGPLEIFYSNYLEFQFNTSDFIWYFIGISVVIAVVVSLVIASLPKCISIVYLVLMLSMGVISYVQYMFINGDLVDDNGNFAVVGDLGWRYSASTVLVFIVLVAVVVIARKFKSSFGEIVSITSIVLTLIMTSAVCVVGFKLLGLENKPGQKPVYSAEDEFVYGTEDNIIVIVLDSFGRYELNEVLKTNPKAIDTFKDFTYYEKEESVYFPTFPSLIHFLTETEYDYDLALDKVQFQEKAFKSENAEKFYGTLHDNGYYVGLFSQDLHSDDYMKNIADNITPSTIHVNHKDVQEKLFKMSAYRYVPYFLKPAFEVYLPSEGNVYGEVVTTLTANDGFKLRIQDWGIRTDPKYGKKFSFTHLHGVHTPFRNDADGNPVEWGSVSQIEATRGVINIMDLYFDMLREAGVYDEATIIVMADHGYKETYDSIFFCKHSYEEHESVNISDEMLTHHDFQRFVIDNIK